MEEDEFKDTEIGRIPKDWEIKKFKDCIKVISFKYSLSKSDYQNNISGRYPIIDQSSNYISGYSNEEEKLFNDPLPVIIFGDHTRIFKYINFPFIPGGDGIKILHSNCENLNLKFLFYQFSSFNIPSRGYNRHFIFLRKFLIKIPPLEEQKRIAHILSKIENAIKIQDRIINSLQELKKSMMHKLFTEGIGHTEFKDTEIGRIPKDWEIISASKIATYYNGYPFKPSQWKNHGLPIIRIQNLTNSSDIIHYFEGTLNKRYQIDKGDLLLSWSATLNVYIWKGPTAYLNQHIFKVVPNKIVDKYYLYFSLLMVINKFKGQTHGSTMKHFVKSALSDVVIPIPPLEEQKRIADILSTIDNKISIEEDRKKYFEALFKTMLNKLMTGQIRVKNLEMRE